MRHSLPTFAAGSLPSWHILITVWTCPFVGSLVPYFHIANRRAVHRSSMFAMSTSSPLPHRPLRNRRAGVAPDGAGGGVHESDGKPRKTREGAFA